MEASLRMNRNFMVHVMDGSSFEVEARVADTVSTLKTLIVEASGGSVGHPFNVLSGTEILCTDALVGDLDKGTLTLQVVVVDVLADVIGKLLTRKAKDGDTTYELQFNQDGEFTYKERYSYCDYGSPRSYTNHNVDAKGTYQMVDNSMVLTGVQDIQHSDRTNGEANYPGESSSWAKHQEPFSKTFTADELGEYRPGSHAGF